MFAINDSFFAFHGNFFLVLSLVRVNCYSFIFPTVFCHGCNTGEVFCTASLQNN